MTKLFNIFDKKKSGSINYKEFISSIRVSDMVWKVTMKIGRAE